MRLDAERFILDVISKLDKSGTNEARYRARFSKMSDAEFVKFCEEIDSGIRQLDIIVPNMVLNIRVEDAYECADYLGISLHEKIRLWDDNDKRYVTTVHPHMVTLLPVRVARQTVLHKHSVGGDRKTDAMTGQVVGEDKASSWSFVQLQTLVSRDLTNTANELIGVRGGNADSYAEFKAQIEMNGTANIKGMSMRTRAADTMSTLLTAMGIGNNL